MPRLRFFVVLPCLLLLGIALNPRPLQAAENNCIQCHQDPQFLVSNKKLHQYFQDWSKSAHSKAGVTCEACHLGDAQAKEKEQAHKGRNNGGSALNFQQIPETCRQCHQEVYQGYAASAHASALSAINGNGPNCVTCHGEMNNQALNVNNVRGACEQCHNATSKNRPLVSDQAERLLNDFNSLHQIYHFLSQKESVQKDQKFMASVSAQMKALAQQWHAMDLKALDATTSNLLKQLKARHKTLPAK